MSPRSIMSLRALCRGEKPRSNFVSLSELFDQIECNLQHYDRIQSTSPESGGPSAPQSPNIKRLSLISSPGRGTSVFLDSPRLSPHEYDPAYEVDPDTFLLLCLPWQVTKPSVIWRRVKTWFGGLFLVRQQPERTPWKCLRTCGPFFHDLTCLSHPLSRNGEVCTKPSPKKSSPKERFSSLKGKEPVVRSRSIPSSSRKEPVTRSKSLPTTLSPSSSSSSIRSSTSSTTETTSKMV